MAAHFTLTLLTDDPDRALAADAAGIDRVGIDLETLGKAARQAGRATRISNHRAESLAKIVPRLKLAAPFARCNPIHAGSKAEVDAVIGYGARVIMLPYFTTLREVEIFSGFVQGRALIVPLVETVEALCLIPFLRTHLGVEECHFGLNDLAIQMGLLNCWDVLEDERLRRATLAARETGIAFGIGGVGRPGDEGVPIPPTQIYRSLLALGANGAATIHQRWVEQLAERSKGAVVAVVRRCGQQEHVGAAPSEATIIPRPPGPAEGLGEQVTLSPADRAVGISVSREFVGLVEHHELVGLDVGIGQTTEHAVRR